MRNRLVEVDLVEVVAVEVGYAELLAREDHGRTVDRAVNGIADKSLPRILVVVLVVRDGVEQDQALPVGRTTQVEHVAVVVGRGGRLPGEDNVLVEDVEVTVRAVSDSPAVQRLGHEDEAPLVASRHVDDVFPRLRRQALAEVAAQSVDAARIQSVARRCVAIGRCAVAIGSGRPALPKPVGRIFREIPPDTLRDAVESSVRSRGVVVEPIGLTRPVVVVGGVPIDQRGVTAEENIDNVEPFTEVTTVGCGGNVVVEKINVTGSTIRVVALPREDAHFAVVDQIRGAPPRGAGTRHDVVDAGLPELDVPRGVIKSGVGHEIDAGRVGIGHEILERSHRGGAVTRACHVGLDTRAAREGGAHAWFHFPEILLRVGAAQCEGKIDVVVIAGSVPNLGVGRRLRGVAGTDISRALVSTFPSVGMVGLEPNPVDPEILQIA